jgi:3-oxoacyl-[acyl-carrier protein] reductase
MLELGLTGKVAIITGGSDGLGRASAERLAAEGVKVAIAARRAEHLEQAAAEIRAATGGDVLAVPADVRQAADCASASSRRRWRAGAASTSCSTTPAPRRRRRWPR